MLLVNALLRILQNFVTVKRNNIPDDLTDFYIVHEGYSIIDPSNNDLDEVDYDDVEEKIYARIINQTKRYLPTISVKDVSFAYQESSNPLQENNTLYVRVEYYIKALNANDVLEVSINSNF